MNTSDTHKLYQSLKFVPLSLRFYSFQTPTMLVSANIYHKNLNEHVYQNFEIGTKIIIINDSEKKTKKSRKDTNTQLNRHKYTLINIR